MCRRLFHRNWYGARTASIPKHVAPINRHSGISRLHWNRLPSKHADRYPRPCHSDCQESVITFRRMGYLNSQVRSKVKSDKRMEQGEDGFVAKE